MNITCPKCRFRHPADQRCEDGATIAAQNRQIRELQDAAMSHGIELNRACTERDNALRRAEKAEALLTSHGRVQAAIEALQREGYNVALTPKA